MMASCCCKHLIILAAAIVMPKMLAASHGDKATAAEGAIRQPLAALPEYLSNMTDRGGLLHPKGWYDPKICTGDGDKWCLFSSRDVARGRGLALISTVSNFQKIRRLEVVMNKMETKVPGPLLEEEDKDEDQAKKQVRNKVMNEVRKEVMPGRGHVGVVATEPIRRGTKLMELTPVLMVHKTFFDEVDEAARGQMMAAALSLLPDKTRALVLQAAAKSPLADNKEGSVESLLRAHPLEASTGGTHWDGPDHGRHAALYPEVVAVAHDCRPNAALYVDRAQLALHLTAARKMAAGARLTVAYVDPRLGREDRRAAAHQAWGRPCACAACTGGGGDLQALAAADARAADLRRIEADLKDADSAAVTEHVLRRYLELLAQDGLHSRMADAYELVAYNYAYLGLEREARKYGNLAMQAAVIEQGRDSNDVTALRVFVNGVTEHYSWRWKMKRPRGFERGG